jgi:hypothetical protein
MGNAIAERSGQSRNEERL